MKEKYDSVIIDIILFDSLDVITASDPDAGPDV